MILVFNQMSAIVGVNGATFNVFIQRAATAAAEIANEQIWLTSTDDT